MRNILVLTASPRKGGNSELLADAFIEGARNVGHNVEKFCAALNPIKPCKACNSCFKDGIPCPGDENFNILAEKLERCDTLVFATPLYWYSFPAQMKSAIDKFYAFCAAERQMSIKDCAMIVCGETDDDDEFNGIISTYNLIAEYQKWSNIGVLKISSVMNIGDVSKTEGLAKAHEFGKSI